VFGVIAVKLHFESKSGTASVDVSGGSRGKENIRFYYYGIPINYNIILY